MNENKYNVWIWQPLLAADIFLVEHLSWDYWKEFHQEGQKIEVVVQPLLMAHIMASVKVVHDEPDKVSSKKEASKNLTPHLDPILTPKWLILIFKKK